MDEKQMQLVGAILTIGYAWGKQFDRVERLCDAYIEIMNQLRYLEQRKMVPVPRGKKARGARQD